MISQQIITAFWTISHSKKRLTQLLACLICPLLLVFCFMMLFPKACLFFLPILSHKQETKDNLRHKSARGSARGRNTGAQLRWISSVFVVYGSVWCPLSRDSRIRACCVYSTQTNRTNHTESHGPLDERKQVSCRRETKLQRKRISKMVERIWTRLWNFRPIFYAVVTRVMFFIHGFLSVWLLAHCFEKTVYWLTMAGVVLLFFEMVYTLLARKGQEYK